MSMDNVNDKQTKKSINIQKYHESNFEKESKGFAQLANIVIQNITDSLAFHIWAYLESKPITWEPNRKELMNHFNIGDEKLAKTLTFLVKSNLIVTHQERLPNGSFGAFKIKVLSGSKFIKLPALNSRNKAILALVPPPENVDNFEVTAPPLTAPPVNRPPAYPEYINKDIYKIKNSEIKNKQTNKESDPVCLFDLYDLEKFGFNQELVNKILKESKIATKQSIQESLEHFNYTMNHTKHNNHNPIGVFRSAINKNGYIKAGFSFKSNQEAELKANQVNVQNQINKQQTEKETNAFKQWKKQVLDYDTDLQKQIIEPILHQLERYKNIPCGKIIILKAKETQFKKYFLDNVYYKNRGV